MLTPNFNITQDNTHIYITVDTPYVKFKEVDILVEDLEFRFYVQPYFLRLHFPHPVVEDETSVAKYDIEKGQFSIKVTKLVEGQHFEDLDLLTKLLTDTKKDIKPKTKNLIEVLDNNATMDTESLIQQVENLSLEDEEFDWSLPQQLPKQSSSEIETLSLERFGYGFNFKYKGELSLSQYQTNEILLFTSPEAINFEKRKQLRIEDENNQFDPEAYMVDYRDEKEEPFQQILDFYFLIHETDLYSDSFNSIEQDQMRNFSKKEFLISITEARHIYLALIDIMLATCYDLRINLGESNVESTWTIGKLSPTMATLDRFDSLQDVLTAFVRRAVTFPLYRTSKLIRSVIQDCLSILEGGRRSVLKLLLYTTRLFKNHTHHYIYADILLKDYCIWLQSDAKDEILGSIYKQMQKLEVKFDKLGFEWDLTKLEYLVDNPPKELKELDLNTDDKTTDSDHDNETTSEDENEKSQSDEDSSDDELLIEVAK